MNPKFPPEIRVSPVKLELLTPSDAVTNESFTPDISNVAPSEPIKLLFNANAFFSSVD